MQQRIIRGFPIFERRRQNGRVQPRDQQLEMLDGDVVKRDLVFRGFQKGAREGGAEIA
jgi:hypothetical protein